MHIDSHFMIGSSHDVCQDYAMTYYRDHTNIAIVGDGCSTISEEDGIKNHLFSDVSSRISVCTFAKTLLDTIFLEENLINLLFHDNLLRQALYNPIGLALGDSTINCIYINNNSDIKWFNIGDGVIVIKNKNGKITIIERYFEPNIPILARYCIDKSWDAWKKLNVKTYSEKIEIVNNEVVEVTKTEIPSQWLYYETFSKQDVESITVFSDGISSFYNGINKEETYKSVLKALEFKNTIGFFVKRRLKRFIENQKELGYINQDDVSMATIYF